MKSIGLVCRYDPGFDSRSVQQKIDLKGGGKQNAVAKRAAPNSLSQLVIACGCSAVTGEGFALTMSLFTLELSIDGMSGGVGNRQRLSAEHQSLGPRPMIEPITIENPDIENAAQIITDFMDAPVQLRRASVALAKKLNLLPFKAALLERHLAHLQADTLVPFGKTFFGAGVGDTILKRAMTGPIAAANQNKRREDAMTRDQLLHLFWSNAMDNGRKRPPLIIM